MKTKPFVMGAPLKPQNAAFYPDDASKEQIEKWIASLPKADQIQGRGFFTVIKRAPNGQEFNIAPYNLETRANCFSWRSFCGRRPPPPSSRP